MTGNQGRLGFFETPQRDRLTGVLVPPGPLELSVEEVRQLWSFVHGDIMDGSLRRLLRASLGLCPRHAWAYAVVEVELWQAGAGARGGHQPFDVTILYEDLLEHVADGLDRKSGLLHRHPEEVLVPVGPCRICQDLASPDLPGLRMGYANSNTEALTVEANALVHTTTWCLETVGLWRDRVCPDCDPGAPEGAGDPVLLCRFHLAGRGPLPEQLRHAVAGRLREIRGRMRHLTESMTDYGSPAGAVENTSWIEALGFFAGWGLPLYLATDPREAWPAPGSQGTEQGG
ncbi:MULTISPECIES: hypothetical protein [Paenarthrobacter]|uniref:Uncharacterized protein n=1 Tax=Paenarthrobacter ureafaciens TaxID=37931 RepID=A0AAX3ED72_PAEUR|nr:MULTISPECIES: hypothetical protein [Paenarthrobacter]HKU34583.1 hypothetical protein [Paenarthrobacter sp.]MDO5865059.1 hypothetical protein [Paenarthrobacter sp. SD-2]MDO5876136.1 hypothetical protein [Paenarthrobacter sp. SD-1]QMU82877.1 hypothetical protein FV140_12765 [Paenarthrobacter ureafaciens]UYV91408.1 hypothetical protein NL395_12685 [Paenarthrobacter ureafaciens]